MTITVSFVDVEPSISTVSNVTFVALRSATSSASGVACASVVMHTSIVASEGAIMPTPLPIAPTVKPSPEYTASLRTRSVVRIASAAA